MIDKNKKKGAWLGAPTMATLLLLLLPSTWAADTQPQLRGRIGGGPIQGYVSGVMEAQNKRRLDNDPFYQRLIAIEQEKKEKRNLSLVRQLEPHPESSRPNGNVSPEHQEVYDVSGRKLVETSVPMLLSEWVQGAYDGQLEEVTDGGLNVLQMSGSGPRIGNSLYTRKWFNFLGSTTYIKWRPTYAISGSCGYAGYGIYASIYHKAVGFTTDHSWDGSYVLSCDEWYFTRFAIEDDGSFTAVTATGDYDDNGGTEVKSYGGTGNVSEEELKRTASKTPLHITFGDNYGSTNAQVQVAELRTTATEIPRPPPSRFVSIYSGEDQIPAALVDDERTDCTWSIVNDGGVNAVMGQATANPACSLKLEVEAGATAIQFVVKANSGNNYNYVRMEVDNVPYWQGAGSFGEYRTVTVPVSFMDAGSQTAVTAAWELNTATMWLKEIKVSYPPSFPEWQFGHVQLLEGDETTPYSLTYLHGAGDGTPSELKIYGLPDDGAGATNHALAATDACYSRGGVELGTLTSTGLLTGDLQGLDVSTLELGVDTGDTSDATKTDRTQLGFTFSTGIGDNDKIYHETGATPVNEATIKFCVWAGLKTTAGGVANYAEFSFDYKAELDGTIVLANAFQVQPAIPSNSGTSFDQFGVTAALCGGASGTLNQGDYFQLCVTSTSYPEASITGIDKLTYSTTAVPPLEITPITGGTSVDPLTLFTAVDDCDGVQCQVVSQLPGQFFPPGGSSSVDISGVAILELGDSGRRVLAPVVLDRRLQELTGLKDFATSVEVAAASDTSGAVTTTNGVTPAFALVFAATSGSLLLSF